MVTIFYTNFGKVFSVKNIYIQPFRYVSNIRVRFAPSPTGDLHLGGLRTVLYNYLFARQNNGRFILRLEDTDQSRVIQGAAEKLYNDLQWLGIQIDEGPKVGGSYGPYVQSERLNIYREYINQLVKEGHAYFCFCSENRLELLRKEAVRNRQTVKYDNRCRSVKKEETLMRLKKGDNFCIRFKLTQDEECCKFDDLIYGKIEYDVTKNEGDPIIVKSDGFPTYHLANVIDDHLMKISHVLRGVEWQISTTKHLMLYKALGWKPPTYGHLPLLVDALGNKFSKRKNDMSISKFRESGIFPNALINFVTTSGGGFILDTGKNVKPKSFNLSQLTIRFSLNNIKSSPGKCDFDRLYDYNHLELETLCKNPTARAKLVRELQQLIRKHFVGKSDTLLQIHQDHVNEVLQWSIDRIKLLSDLVKDEFLYLWCIPDFNIEDLTVTEVEIIRSFCEALESKQFSMTKQVLNQHLHKLAELYHYNFPALMKLMRSVLSGLEKGPSVAEMMMILGRENSLLRLKMFIEKYEAKLCKGNLIPSQQIKISEN